MRFIEFLIENEIKERAQHVAKFIKDEVLPKFGISPTKARLAPNPQDRTQYILSLDMDTRGLHKEHADQMDEMLKGMGAKVKKLVVRSRRQRLVFVIDHLRIMADDEYDEAPHRIMADDEYEDKDFERIVDIGDEDDWDDEPEQQTYRGFNGRLVGDNPEDDERMGHTYTRD